MAIFLTKLRGIGSAIATASKFPCSSWPVALIVLFPIINFPLPSATIAWGFKLLTLANTLKFPNISPSIPGGKVALGGRDTKSVFLIIFSKGRKLIFAVSIFAKKLPCLSFPSILI